ncbi:MAG: sigma-54 interaction domain-containing protein [Gemmatimonadota bacterium]
MSGSRPTLTVVQAADAFASVWGELASGLGCELRVEAEPVPVRGSDSVGVILACGGEESRAVELLHAAHRVGLQAPLVVGAEPDHRLAVELMRRGAGGYFALPADGSRLEAELQQRSAALAASPEKAGLRELERQAYDFSAILGEDPALHAALDRAAKVIPGGRTTVLITGETGTGKELVARAIHYNGPRSGEPFVAVNCSAIPGSLLESELFGHEKGAFTDARAAKPGLFEVADGGTLFLDEVATLLLELQAKLLRFLETREVRRLGGVREKRVDVRILAATNEELGTLVARGAFREDLFYRLAVVPIRLPPLRARGADVRLLARRFLAELAESYELDVPELTRRALAALERHPWPGNVRELRNAIERSLLLSAGDPISPEHLALGVGSGDRVRGGGPREPGEGSSPSPLPFPATLEELEAVAVRETMRLCGGNKSEAARLLGIARSRLYRMLERAGE